jgi:hypothetical protein
MSLWSACASVGKILGTVIASHTIRIGCEIGSAQ